jgi:hypothetical protein
MENRQKALELGQNEPNMTWEQVVKLYSSRGFKGDDLWKEIISSSQRNRASVNAELGL